MDDARARRECRAFTRYLIGREPDAYVLAKYAQALAANSPGEPTTRFDRALLALALTHPLLTRAVDVYARWLGRGAAVRKRAVLTLAILETWAPTCRELEEVGTTHPLALALRAAGQLAGSAVLLVLAVVVLTPLRLALGGRGRPARPGATR